MEEIVQATCQYNKSQVLLTLQPNFENMKGCVVLMVLLWIPPGLKFCTSILDHLKEDVIKIQQQNMWKRFANFRKDQECIADFRVRLNLLVSLYAIYHHSLSSHSFITQPNFQASLGFEESLEEASKSSYK